MDQNSAEPTKIYLGNLQEKSRQSGDKFLVGSICLDDIEKVSSEQIQRGKNGKRYLKVVISAYRNGANAYGNTHSVSLDTFKPKYENRIMDESEPVRPDEYYNKENKATEIEVDGNSIYDPEFFKE
jgi:hypothetical protein